MIGRKIKYSRKDENLYYEGIVVDKVLVRQPAQGFENYTTFAVTAYIVLSGGVVHIVLPQHIVSIEE